MRGELPPCPSQSTTIVVWKAPDGYRLWNRVRGNALFGTQRAGCVGSTIYFRGERCEPNALASGDLRENDAPQRPVASAIGSVADHWFQSRWR